MVLGYEFLLGARVSYSTKAPLIDVIQVCSIIESEAKGDMLDLRAISMGDLSGHAQMQCQDPLLKNSEYLLAAAVDVHDLLTFSQIHFAGV
jgi:hypothetical protein